MKRYLFCLVHLLFVPFVNADQTSAWSSTGYIDGSYSALTMNNRFTSGVYDRVFDLNPDGMTLHQGSYTLAYQPKEGFGALINPILGFDPFIFSPYGWNPSIGMKQVGFDIPQSYLQFAYDKMTVMGGAFVTLAGQETIRPIKNTNSSRAILFGYAIPFTHLGARTMYQVNDELCLSVGVNNGWDNIRDTTRRKTLELSLAYTPNALFSFAVTGYSGGERPIVMTNFGPVSTRNLIDITTTMNLNKQLSLSFNYDYVLGLENRLGCA